MDIYYLPFNIRYFSVVNNTHWNTSSTTATAAIFTWNRGAHGLVLTELADLVCYLPSCSP